jgi:penicillin-binding protein A
VNRRIRYLGALVVVCLSLVIAQLVNIQLVKAPALQTSANNPRNAGENADNQRGKIFAADGTLLAQSVRSGSAGSYDYLRQYPEGSLYSQVVGYASTEYGTAGLEYQYDGDLVVHTAPPQNLPQVLGLSKRQSTDDNLTTTIEPRLQQAAQAALTQIVGPNKDAAVVAVIPQTGAVVADYSTPTFDPTPLASPSRAVQQAAWSMDYLHKDPEGYYPGLPLATAEPIFPGSTFKVVTTAAVYNLAPQLSNFTFPDAGSTKLPNSNLLLENDGGSPCGGDIKAMLPQSCDPGYGLLGIALGADTLSKQAQLFGYDATPPVDLPMSWVATPNFPSPASISPPNQAFLAYSAIGQYNVTATALSNALVAAGIANGGVIMKPYLVQQITTDQGAAVSTHTPTPWMTATTPQAASQVSSLMQLVVTQGTAEQDHFPASLDAAVKTGTAQTGRPKANTDDWMIGFAPANNPKIAVAVAVPDQDFSGTGALVAGPIMIKMLEAALNAPQG